MPRKVAQPDTRPLIPGIPTGDTPSETSSAASPVATGAESAPENTVQVVLDGHTREGLGFSFKVLSSGALFRCQPVRHPRQPRFWCVSICHCFAGGSADESQPEWISDQFLTREELPEAMASIRADLTGWLTDAARRDLYDWVLTQVSRSPLTQEMRYGEKAAVP